MNKYTPLNFHKVNTHMKLPSRLKNQNSANTQEQPLGLFVISRATNSPSHFRNSVEKLCSIKDLKYGTTFFFLLLSFTKWKKRDMTEVGRKSYCTASETGNSETTRIYTIVLL